MINQYKELYFDIHGHDAEVITLECFIRCDHQHQENVVRDMQQRYADMLFNVQEEEAIVYHDEY